MWPYQEYEPDGDDKVDGPDQGIRDSEPMDDEEPRRGPSEKQLRANRENAKKSTGPRTDAGKARSSQNARKSGIFVTKIEPVQDGPIGEDPDEFYERVGLLVESMHPRDAVEIEVATRIAGVLVKLERLDRWSATSIGGASIMRPSDIEAGARSEARLDLLARAASALHMYFFNPDLVEDPDFEAMAVFLRFQGPEAEVSIPGLWDDENTPSSKEEWRRVCDALKNTFWSDDEEAESWARDQDLKLSRKFEQVENLEERMNLPG